VAFAAEDAPAPKQKTVVRGGPGGALAGRWLAIAWLDLPDGKTRTVPVLWDLSEEEGALSLRMRYVSLPAPQLQALERANGEGRRWQPISSDMEALASGWDTLAPAPAPLPLSVETEILGREAFDDALRNDPKTRDALWAVRQTEDLSPAAGAVARETRQYAVLSGGEDHYAGAFVHVAVAMALIPVPITFQGTFELHRLGGARRSFWQRLLDPLTGCGRKARAAEGASLHSG
jgi:hypothetical protein